MLSAAAGAALPAQTVPETPATRERPAASRVEGRVVDSRGVGIPGVEVWLGERRVAVTDADGSYGFEKALGSGAGGVDSKPLRLSLRWGEFSAQDEARLGSSEALTTRVDWPVSFAETVTVEAASRTPERLVEAPAAVASLGEGEIARRSGLGQLPLLLTALPGVQLTQSGLYDFNLNARGFNTYVNRRVLTLIDGRDPSIPAQAGGQEWAEFSFAADELSRIEMVRGPGAALYGAGAFNGVLTLTTRAPRDSQGGRLRLTAGEPDSFRLDVRHAGRLTPGQDAETGAGWFYKVVAGYGENEEPTLARTDAVEYAGLPFELVAPPEDRFESLSGSLRLDRDGGEAGSLVLEVGGTDFGGTTFVSDLGRLQTVRSERPWARFRWHRPKLRVSGFYTGQDVEHAALAAGTPIFLDSYHVGLELQTDLAFDEGRGQLVAGAAVGERSTDSADPSGVQTTLVSPQDTDRQAIFGQVSYELGESVKAVVSLRWDESTLHDARLSPRLALVWAAAPRHTLRATYSEAFQSPTEAEFFLRAPVGPSFDLSSLEAGLAPILGGVELGFANIPLLAVGNESLEVEEITSWEVGYSGVLGDRVFVTASYYDNELSNFTTNLLLQTGTSLGRLNPDFGPYRPPSALSTEAQDAVLAALAQALPPDFLAALSNDASGAPLIALLSRTNFGRAETRGLEASLQWAPSPRWIADLNYTYFDFEIAEQAPESPIRPNTSEHQIGAGLAYVGERLDATLRFRWVDGFEWSSGVFVGRVDAYRLFDLSVGYRLGERWALGLQVANLFDDEHIEQFGGDLLPRRAVASLKLSW
ncbi:MAG: TonB-dependent receptor [Acidobacteriota bacterium]